MIEGNPTRVDPSRLTFKTLSLTDRKDLEDLEDLELMMYGRAAQNVWGLVPMIAHGRVFLARLAPEPAQRDQATDAAQGPASPDVEAGLRSAPVALPRFAGSPPGSSQRGAGPEVVPSPGEPDVKAGLRLAPVALPRFAGSPVAGTTSGSAQPHESGEAVGWCILNADWHDRTAAYLWSFAVAQQHHHRGIGSRLLAHVLETLPREGYRRLEVVVAPSNARAVHLATRAGFERAAALPEYFGPSEDRWLLVKLLTPQP